ncbi:3'-5' exonuclease, partial [Flavobacteriaceae bacterium]|nr:3'-5' exonuclease [Flavobacteriaceae bacterium]
MKILFFDTETTGLPKNWKAPVEQIDNWPRLVQIAWQVYDQDENLIEEHEYIIKPDGFSIPLDATEVHKITTQKASEIGENINKVLSSFYQSVDDADILVAHNYSYDYSVVGSELLRNEYDNILKSKDHICTMLSSTDF